MVIRKSIMRKQHWYMITYYECPVCGCGSELRTRMYTPKPEQESDRHEFVDEYDGCLG